MKRTLGLFLLAALPLAAPAGAHAAPIPGMRAYALTMTIDATHDESDQPGVVRSVHAVGKTVMHEGTQAGKHVCTMDSYQLNVSANGVTEHKMIPAIRCDQDTNAGDVLQSMDFGAFPTHPRTHWVDDQRMSVAQAMQSPIDQRVAALLNPVSWHTVYNSDDKTFVTSHGVGFMLEDRPTPNGVATLHAHFAGTSAMSARVSPQGAPASMTMSQSGKLYLKITAKATGASVSEHDMNALTITLHSM